MIDWSPRKPLGSATSYNRSLKAYFLDVAEPPGNDSASTAKWLEALVGHVLRDKISGMVGLGGDTALHPLASTIPDLLTAIDSGGVSPVAVYTLSTRMDDLATFERIGLPPAATALILNCGLADQTVDRETAFARVRRHSVYRAAIERGAVKPWMPWMERSVAEAIETKSVSFAAARDAISPSDRKVPRWGCSTGLVFACALSRGIAPSRRSPPDIGNLQWRRSVVENCMGRVYDDAKRAKARTRFPAE